MSTLDELISNDELRKEAKKELDRRRKAAFYLNNPFLFHKEVLCPEKWKDFLAPLHEEGLEWINQGKRKKLILWPRKHL